jgi:G:T-mismatch repair DNA endonuclease (very short patch repair protein)
VVECFGDYWHMNPTVYLDDAYNHHLKMTASEKRALDTDRLKDLEKMGYKVIVLWEKDLNKNGIEKTVHESIK